MAEKFGVGSGPHELKIGSSFAANGKNGKFHTIRYDFKPASLDPTKSGVLDIGESNSLNVKLPHSNGTTETNYSGHMRDSSQKECVLIIDRNTGEITLEKLSKSMQLKKTRQERPEKSAQIEKFISAGSSSQQPTSSSNYNFQSSSSSNSRPQTPISALTKKDSPAGTPKPLSRSASPHIPNQQQVKQSSSTVPLKSVSLSSESSSSSSSSGSDSDSDLEDVPPFQSKKAPVEPSMPSFLDSEPSSVTSSSHSKQQRNVQPPPAASMPQVLNDDLQLSESDDGGD